MAKLNGVTTVDMTNGEITRVSYQGEEYTKVATDKGGRTGDIAMQIANALDIDAGGFYEVIDTANTVVFMDNDDYLRDRGGHSVVLFRKNPAVPQISEPFAEIITDKIDAVGAKVSAVEERVSALEVARESATTPIFNEGDRVKALRGGEFGNVFTGEYGEVTRTCANATIDPYHIRVIAEDGRIDYFRPQDLELASEEESLRVGDFVIFTKDYCEHKIGKVSVIREIDGDSTTLPYGLSTPNSETDGWANEKDVRKATGAEVAKATAPTKPVVGDIVVITGNTNSSRNKVGDIGKFAYHKYNDEDSVTVDVPDNPKTAESNGNFTKLTEMRLATVSEKSLYAAAIIDAKKAEEQAEAKDAVFTKAGRKPDEYRKGDVVQVIAKGTHSYGLGDVVEIVDFSGHGLNKIKAKYIGGSVRVCPFLYEREIKPVTFAEDRKDMAKGVR